MAVPHREARLGLWPQVPHPYSEWSPLSGDICMGQVHLFRMEHVGQGLDDPLQDSKYAVAFSVRLSGSFVKGHQILMFSFQMINDVYTDDTKLL